VVATSCVASIPVGPATSCGARGSRRCTRRAARGAGNVLWRSRLAPLHASCRPRPEARGPRPEARGPRRWQRSVAPVVRAVATPCAGPNTRGARRPRRRSPGTPRSAASPADGNAPHWRHPKACGAGNAPRRRSPGTPASPPRTVATPGATQRPAAPATPRAAAAPARPQARPAPSQRPAPPNGPRRRQRPAPPQPRHARKPAPHRRNARRRPKARGAGDAPSRHSPGAGNSPLAPSATPRGTCPHPTNLSTSRSCTPNSSPCPDRLDDGVPPERVGACTVLSVKSIVSRRRTAAHVATFHGRSSAFCGLISAGRGLVPDVRYQWDTPFSGVSQQQGRH
jgi:hypothetical protein